MTSISKKSLYPFLSISIIAFIYWFSTINQPLVDLHDFRQTQTAISSLFINRVDNILRYHTPVFGSPWSIPMELPIYQYIVNLFSSSFNIDISLSGRIISIFFGVMCIVPASLILREFHVNKTCITTFLILYLSSGIYLYWNRTFMIESTSLFATLSSSYLYLLVRRLAFLKTNLCSFLTISSSFWIFASIALTIKATTALPTFILFVIDWIYLLVKSIRSKNYSSVNLRLYIIGFLILFSFICLVSWVNYADYIKSLNFLGEGLTSKSLRSWNYGNLQQRFSSDLWFGVLVDRMITIVGLLPFIILCSLYSFSNNYKSNSSKNLLYISIFLLILPLLLFPNLHIRHNYYQTANQLYLLVIVSIIYSSINDSTIKQRNKNIATFCLFSFILGSYIHFNNAYLKYSFLKSNDKLEIGKFVIGNTKDDSAILVFDDDWHPGIAFHSNRYSLSHPNLSIDPQYYLNTSKELLGGKELGAIATKITLPDFELSNACEVRKTLIKGQWKVFICHESN